MFKPLPLGVPFIQVLHVRNHWITVSNVKPHSDSIFPDTVCIYDSNWSTEMPMNFATKRQICSFFKSKAKKIYFDIINVERQKDSFNCGAYALAFATELARGGDPASFFWSVGDMRNHILTSLKTGSVLPFPKKKERRLGFGKRVMCSFKEPIDCNCRMPNDGEVYIECGNCREWYHLVCVGLKSKFSHENIKWTCQDCINFIQNL